MRASPFRMAVVAILGAGSWGTALAMHLARLGHRVALWARSPAVAATLAQQRNSVYLPGLELPPTVVPTAELTEACADASAVVFACPSIAIRALAGAVDLTERRPLLVSVAKGVEQDTRLTMSQVIEQVVDDEHRARVGALSGPSFAREVA